MDLQLGLGISSSSPSSTDEFNDSNVYGIQNHHQMSGAFSYIGLADSDNSSFVDQTFDEMNSDRRTPPTLSLLVWDENDEDLHTEINSLEYNKDVNGDVGWPPISARRKKMYNQNSEERMFVKVKMEGEGIGRKVDLNLHHSLQSLIQTLVAMFGKYEESVYSYNLVYQDEMGFWKLAEEDSWETLIRSACRLRLMRNNY